MVYIPVITTKTLEVNQTSSSPIKTVNESPLCQKLSLSLSLLLSLSHNSEIKFHNKATATQTTAELSGYD